MRASEIMNDVILRPAADVASRYAKYEPLMNGYGLDGATTAVARLKEMFAGTAGPAQVLHDVQQAWDVKLAQVKATMQK